LAATPDKNTLSDVDCFQAPNTRRARKVEF
jgi:hypothetical protein